jgi:hypothetical protein
MLMLSNPLSSYKKVLLLPNLLGIFSTFSLAERLSVAARQPGTTKICVFLRDKPRLISTCIGNNLLNLFFALRPHSGYSILFFVQVFIFSKSCFFAYPSLSDNRLASMSRN